MVDSNDLCEALTFLQIHTLSTENVRRFRGICSAIQARQTSFGRDGVPHVAIFMAGCVSDPVEFVFEDAESTAKVLLLAPPPDMLLLWR